MKDAVTATQDAIERDASQAEPEPGRAGDFEIEWCGDAKLTPNGTVVYFAQYLGAAGLFDRLCETAPLRYTSNNAPEPRDIIGSILLSVLNGQTRYAHINALRNDRAAAELLGMSKIVSEDSVRRALGRGSPEEWDAWLSAHERAVWEPLLAEPYVIDIDSTVCPLHGHQEGAETGYNPRKPGRPSHSRHTCFIGALRLVLSVDIQSGKAHAASHGMPSLWRLIDTLGAGRRPRLIRGDAGYGSDAVMRGAEARSLPYLFKLRRSALVKSAFRKLCASAPWADTGDGWQACGHPLKLSGWQHPRRCIFLRRPAGARPASDPAPDTQAHFGFIQPAGPPRLWEYACLATNDETLPLESAGRLYRDRADCENVFDEIKNQWGWRGFMTRDLRRCRAMARLTALIYNWWNIFTRLANPGTHLEAVTSRPLLLNTLGRLVHSGRRKILRLTSNHALADRIRAVFERIGAFLNRLGSTAEQLSPPHVWALILSAAFVKWLRGRHLRPVSEGDQLLLNLLL